MKRILFILVAFSILNQSIDLDYITLMYQHVRSSAAPGYDDIDSITELLIESIVGEDDYMPEDYHDDNGNAQHNGIIKYAWSPLIYHTDKDVAVAERDDDNNSRPGYSNPDNYTCKGYIHIISPPPDMTA
ncbi:MAG: hypothetical protein QM731_04555 [Chitinophagaceae bacterium]